MLSPGHNAAAPTNSQQLRLPAKPCTNRAIQPFMLNREGLMRPPLPGERLVVNGTWERKGRFLQWCSHWEAAHAPTTLMQATLI